MKYDDGIQLNADRKVIKCPLCGNSVIDEKDTHCSICGCMLYNLCLNDNEYGYNCNHHNIGNARYCVLCGSETSFSRENVLMNWSDAKEINIKRMLLELDITKESPFSSFLFEWDYILFLLEGQDLLLTCLEKSKAKIIADKLLIYLDTKKQKTILAGGVLNYILFNSIDKICKDENLDFEFETIILISPEDNIETIFRTDRIPF